MILLLWILSLFPRQRKSFKSLSFGFYSIKGSSRQERIWGGGVLLSCVEMQNAILRDGFSTHNPAFWSGLFLMRQKLSVIEEDKQS